MLERIPIRFTTAAGALLALAACGNVVVPVTGSIPTPVVQTLPISVGVYMDEEFRTFSHSEQRQMRQEWSVSSGQMNEEMFSSLFASMFQRTVPIEQAPDQGGFSEDLDALLRIEVTEFGFLTPRDTGQKFFAVSFKYRLAMWEPDGTPIATWPVVGYGKSAWKAFQDESGLREATAIAIRDGAAAVALGFEKVPAIAKWLETKGIGGENAYTAPVE